MRIKAISNGLALIATAISLALAAPAKADCISHYGPNYGSPSVVPPMKLHVFCHSSSDGGSGSGDGPSAGQVVLLLGGIVLSGILIGALSKATNNRVGQDGKMRWDW